MATTTTTTTTMGRPRQGTSVPRTATPSPTPSDSATSKWPSSASLATATTARTVFGRSGRGDDRDECTDDDDDDEEEEGDVEAVGEFGAEVVGTGDEGGTAAYFLRGRSSVEIERRGDETRIRVQIVERVHRRRIGEYLQFVGVGMCRGRGMRPGCLWRRQGFDWRSLRDLSGGKEVGNERCPRR